MKRIIWFVVGLVVFVGIVTLIYNWSRNPQITVFETKIEENDWKAIHFSNDSQVVLKVIYQEKYGVEKTIFCKVVFENSKTAEYKCVAPWLDGLVLQKSNINSFQVNKVSRDEIK